MSGFFGPQTANAVTTKPNNTAVQRYGGVQTWFTDCSGPGASDGTVPNAAFYNRIVGALDYLCAAAGVSGIAGDDSILYRAVLQAISQDAPDALNSLRELAAAIGDDPNFAGTLMSMLANRLRFDQSQYLNATQKNQAYVNLGLAQVATSGDYNSLANLPALGTAASKNVGTGANNVVQLDASSKLPAVDGSQLTGLVGYTALARAKNVLGADVNLNNSAYTDGPSVAAPGGTGDYLCTGYVTLLDTGVAGGFSIKLWDGTTVISSTTVNTPAANVPVAVTLSGIATNPAAALRISVLSGSAATGRIKANISGIGKDSQISVVKIA